MKCATRNCGRLVSKSCKSPYCPRCHSRRWRDKFPLHYSFKNLRVRAKQRGKEFSLTRDEYIAFAVSTDYAKLKGKTSLSLSIDRIDPTKGYTKENIQAITLRENSRRQFTNMPGWMKEEYRLACQGVIPDSHKELPL